MTSSEEENLRPRNMVFNQINEYACSATSICRMGEYGRTYRLQLDYRAGLEASLFRQLRQNLSYLLSNAVFFEVAMMIDAVHAE